MIRLLTAGLLFLSWHTVAEVTLTPLSNNTPADADHVMGNFNALNEALPPSDCTTDQIIKWDASSEAWVCANLSGPQLETVYVDCTEGFATPDICRATCPDGKQLVSGGCAFNYLNQAIYLQSHPESISWSCGIGDGGAGSHVASAYAICQ